MNKFTYSLLIIIATTMITFGKTPQHAKQLVGNWHYEGNSIITGYGVYDIFDLRYYHQTDENAFIFCTNQQKTFRGRMPENTSNLTISEDGHFIANHVEYQLSPTDAVREFMQINYSGKWSIDSDTLSLLIIPELSTNLNFPYRHKVSCETFHFRFVSKGDTLKLYPVKTREITYQTILGILNDYRPFENNEIKRQTLWQLITVFQNSQSKLTAYSVYQAKQAIIESREKDSKPLLKQLIEAWYKNETGLPPIPLKKHCTKEVKTEALAGIWHIENMNEFMAITYTFGARNEMPENVVLQPKTPGKKSSYLELTADGKFTIHCVNMEKKNSWTEECGTWTLNNDILKLQGKEVNSCYESKTFNIPWKMYLCPFVEIINDKLYLKPNPYPVNTRQYINCLINNREPAAVTSQIPLFIEQSPASNYPAVKAAKFTAYLRCLSGKKMLEKEDVATIYQYLNEWFESIQIED